MTDVQWMFTGADVVDSDCTKLVEWMQKAHALDLGGLFAERSQRPQVFWLEGGQAAIQTC